MPADGPGYLRIATEEAFAPPELLAAWREMLDGGGVDDPGSGFVFDAGAFVALERRAPLLLGILEETLLGTVEVVLPRTVIAQVWRGTPRQANVSRLISAGRRRDSPVIIDELTAERAREIGVAIGRTSHPDIVDVHVAQAAAERGHAVLTSDDADIAGVNPDLVLVHV